MMKIDWQGVYPAVTTQYNDDMSINFVATQNMVDSLIKEGVDDIIALGTVGENCSHTREEKKTILIAVKEVVAGRVPVISGVAETTAQFAVEYSQMCEQLAGRGSEITRAPRLPLSGDERARVKVLYNQAVATRINLSKFNLD